MSFYGEGNLIKAINETYLEKETFLAVNVQNHLVFKHVAYFNHQKYKLLPQYKKDLSFYLTYPKMFLNNFSFIV